MAENSTPGEADDRYLAAKRHVVKLRAFYTSLAIYVVVNLLLFLVDLASDDGWWFWWVSLFWGIGILLQGFDLVTDRWGRDWEERKIQERLAKER